MIEFTLGHFGGRDKSSCFRYFRTVFSSSQRGASSSTTSFTPTRRSATRAE